jgi:hypothetical protein
MTAIVACFTQGWRAIPPRHFAIAFGIAVLWAAANTLGWWLAHETMNAPRMFAHLFYESLLTMMLLALGIGMADAITRDDPNAVTPYAIAVVAAVVVGQLLFLATAPLLDVARCDCSMDSMRRGVRAGNMLPDAFLICGFVTAGYRYWRRASLRLARINARELERAQLTRRTLESRLQAMQACIEPQFLFDTLGTVERLHASDRRTAVQLLDELIVYLRAALPHLRESTSTVAKETELAHAWLNIQRLRRGGGPAFAIDVDTGAESARMPPMVLLPLVDYVLGNLADVPSDCSLRIMVRAAGDRLRFELAAQGAAGVAAQRGPEKLAGMRDRLHTLYGDAARLTLGSDEGHSILVTLDIPHEHADRDHR